jgi:hypothetical protein
VFPMLSVIAYSTVGNWLGQAVQIPVEDHGDSLFCIYPAISEYDWRALCPKIEKKIKGRATHSLCYSLQSLSTHATFLM